jgi:maleate isomerase
MKKLGILIPSSNTTVEREFSRVLYGVDLSLHFSRMHLENVTVKDLLAMKKETVTASRLLKDADVDMLVFACTSGTLYKSARNDQAIVKKIVKATCLPVVATANAVIQSLRKLEVQRISLATPYIEEINSKEIAFLKHEGFDVTNVCSLNIRENRSIGQLSTADAVSLGTRANSESAEALFISCTNFQTFEAIPVLERNLKKPVITSNSATLWAALKALKIDTDLSLGRLFYT